MELVVDDRRRSLVRPCAGDELGSSVLRTSVPVRPDSPSEIKMGLVVVPVEENSRRELKKGGKPSIS